MTCFTPLVNKKDNLVKRAGIFVSLFCFFILVSCSGEEIVASVNDNTLSRQDAEIMMQDLGYDINKKDDWNRFLDTWIRNEVMRQELSASNPERYKALELRSEDYLGNLSVLELEEREILKKLDTVVTEEEIKRHFEENRESFLLQDYLVKALYLKISKEAAITDDLAKAFLLKNDKDLSKVNSYAKIYAENYYFDDEQWVYFTELTKDIPLKQFNVDNIVLNRTKTYFSDEEYTYFLNIIDYTLKDETPPLDFLKPQIREIILSERINHLREGLGSSLYAKIRKKYDVSNNYH
jgi:hypothetical protein